MQTLIQQPEQLAERLLVITDRRVQLSNEAEKHLRAALHALDSVQREVDLATEARGELVAQELALKLEAAELREKQNVNDPATLMASTLADRKLPLIKERIAEADRFVADATKIWEDKWLVVRHVAKVILSKEQQARSALVTELIKLLFADVHPNFIASALANSTVTKPLNSVLWDVSEITGPNDRFHGNVQNVVPIARALL
jgi:hypothetical protein